MKTAGLQRSLDMLSMGRPVGQAGSCPEAYSMNTAVRPAFPMRSPGLSLTSSWQG